MSPNRFVSFRGSVIVRAQIANRERRVTTWGPNPAPSRPATLCNLLCIAHVCAFSLRMGQSCLALPTETRRVQRQFGLSAARRHGPLGVGGMHHTVRLRCRAGGGGRGGWLGRVGPRRRVLSAPPPGARITDAGPLAPNHAHRIYRGAGFSRHNTTGKRLCGVDVPASSARVPGRRRAPAAAGTGQSG